MKIKNDASVIDAKVLKIIEGLKPHRVVLRKLHDDEYCPYVTHVENMRLDTDGNTFVHEEFYWGHYFTTLEEAKKDFEER